MYDTLYDMFDIVMGLHSVFLKAIIPSRRATKEYPGEEDLDEAR